MAKIFKGQVKVSDIQNEFTRLVNAINAIVDKYNTALDLVGDDLYQTGTPNLSAPGYALSVGGLKTLLKAFKGFAIGTRVYRYGTNLIVTKGVYIKDNETIIKLPQAIVTPANKNPSALFFNTNTNTYLTNGTASDTVIKVCDLNANRYHTDDACTSRSFDVEDIKGGMTIRCGPSNVNPRDSQPIGNNQTGMFIRTWSKRIEGGLNDGVLKNSTFYFQSRPIGFTQIRGYKQYNYYIWAPIFYIPKLVGNPFVDGAVNQTDRGVVEPQEAAKQIKPCVAIIKKGNDILSQGTLPPARTTNLCQTCSLAQYQIQDTQWGDLCFIRMQMTHDGAQSTMNRTSCEYYQS